MPKVPKFQVRNTGRGWKVNVPKSISDTGKKQELYFPTREKAAAKATELRDGFRKHGEKATALAPRVADDAAKAWSILEPLGLTLTQAARELAAKYDVQARSVPLEDAAAAWVMAIEGDLRPATMTSYKLTITILLRSLRGRKMAGLTAAEIQTAISGKSYAMHKRNARALWGWAAAASRQWCDPKVFGDMDAARLNRDGDIAVLRPELVELLLRTAEKYYPETVCVYAVGFFSGARVEELKRLTGDEFDIEGIEMGPTVTKKRRRRHVPMNDTLAAWLKEYPYAPCPAWTEKHCAVRALAGWAVKSRLLKSDPPPSPLGAWPRNVIRHTHATAEIANGAKLEDLLFQFGHTEGPEMLRSHYVGRYTKKEAVAFWSIGPKGTKIRLLKTA